MRLEKLKLGGWIPFPNPVELDLTALGDDARLVALVGPNGGGKSTLVELGILGACYRQLATRGKLSELAVARDAYVEATIVNGRRWTVRQLCDSVSGGGEALVLDEYGQPVGDTKLTWFKDWSSQTFPDFGVLTCGLFSAQGSEGLLDAKTTERKRLILRAAGVERFEIMAERARKNASAAGAQIDTLAARIADERARGGDPQALEADLAKARESAAQADQALAQARQDLEQARQRAAEHSQAERDAQAIRELRARLKADADLARGNLRDLDARIANNRRVLAEGDKIRAAASDLDGVRAHVAACKTERARLNAERDALYQRGQDQVQQRAAACRRLAQAEQRLAEGDEIRAAVLLLPDLEDAAQRAAVQVFAQRALLEELQGQRIAGADERIDGLRLGLSEICAAAHETDGDVLGTMAADAIQRDDETVEQARALPGRIDKVRNELAALEQAAQEAAAALAKMRDMAAKAPALEQAQADRDAAQSEIDGLQEPEAREQQLRDVRSLIASLDVTSDHLERSMTELEPLAAKLVPLQNAEARLAELEPQRSATAERLTTLETELSDTPEPGQLSPAPDVSGFERAHQAAQRETTAAHGRVAVAEKALEAARVSAEHVAALEIELQTAGAELADWRRLAIDLGKDGLQAAETDAVGPELTELTNDLLHNCFSTRWTVRIETQRASSDGKRAIEGCEIRVLDTETGVDVDAKRYSGGQRAIIGEAVSLALSMIACNRAGVSSPTLVRDESDAALNDENAEAYAKMLRRAADHIGADRVLVISHKAAMVGLCDAVIEVGGGQIRAA